MNTETTTSKKLGGFLILLALLNAWFAISLTIEIPEFTMEMISVFQEAYFHGIVTYAALYFLDLLIIVFLFEGVIRIFKRNHLAMASFVMAYSLILVQIFMNHFISMNGFNDMGELLRKMGAGFIILVFHAMYFAKSKRVNEVMDFDENDADSATMVLYVFYINTVAFFAHLGIVYYYYTYYGSLQATVSFFLPGLSAIYLCFRETVDFGFYNFPLIISILTVAIYAFPTSVLGYIISMYERRAIKEIYEDVASE